MSNNSHRHGGQKHTRDRSTARTAGRRTARPLQGHFARKRFGQNFLVDAGVIDGIVRAIAPQPGDTLVEIGPGLAALTQPLLAQAKQLTVIEIDRDLAARLRHQAGLTVIEADALQVDFTALAAQLATHMGYTGGHTNQEPSPASTAPQLRLVGNLPYNISTPLLFHLLAHAAVVRDQHFMLQKEVIDRMVAPPATAAYGRLSVMLQWRYAMEEVLFVGPECFDPPPKVDSAVVRMVPYTAPAVVNAEVLSELVQVAFSQRRKLLRHTLGTWLQSRGFAGEFDVQRRAEEVPVAEYIALAQAVAPVDHIANTASAAPSSTQQP